MKRLIVVLGLLVAALLAACGPETTPNATSLRADASDRAEATPLPAGRPTLEVATVTPIPASEPTSPPVSSATADLAPGHAESPIRTPTPTATPGDAFPLSTAPTPIPTPDVNRVTVPELDNIAFVHRQPLRLPEGVDHFSFGLTVWSPDSQRFVGIGPSDEIIIADNYGHGISDLYLGTIEGSVDQLVLIQHNADSPSWSRDGNSVYYVSLYSDGSRLYQDLYQLNLALASSELVASDVGRPYLPALAALETTEGMILTLDREHRPSIVVDAGGQTRLTPLMARLSLRSHEKIAGFISLAPDARTIAVMPSLGRQVEEGLRRSFADRPVERPLFLADLTTNTILNRLPGPVETFRDVAWTSDSQKLAYANREGVFVYDLQSHILQPLITRGDLGFPPDEIRSGFERPIWSPDQKVVLFSAGTPDWEYGIVHYTGYLFAATSNGAHWKGLGRTIIDSMAPDGTRAIIAEASSDEMNPEVKYLAEIVWR